MGSDFLQLDPAAAGAGGLTRWLADALRDAVDDARLPVGSRLPATRVLAAELGVSRGVVVEAYQRLIDEGRAITRRSGGTLIAAAAAPPTKPAPPAPVRAAAWDLSPGLPDLAAFPRAAWLRAERDVLARITAADLGYGDPRGTPVLRGELAGWLGRRRGIRVHPEEIVIVAGVA